jgi:hypothetical protein
VSTRRCPEINKFKTPADPMMKKTNNNSLLISATMAIHFFFIVFLAVFQGACLPMGPSRWEGIRDV